MSVFELGKKLTENQPRDAVHVAIMAVKADHDLKPGEHIGMINNRVAGTHYIHGHYDEKVKVHTIGIVDPFLTETVKSGEWFWMILYPNSVKNLRHSWDHDEIHSDSDWSVYEDDDGCRGC